MYSDEEIRRLVLDQLSWDGRLVNSRIDAEVMNGEVILKGTVSSYSARQAAEADTLLVPGVLKVNDQMVIEYPGGVEKVADRELKTSMLNRFLWNPSIPASQIDVEVRDGNVTIKGTVDGYWKKIRAEEIAYDMRGVIHVKNELVVVPSRDYTDREIAESIINAFERSGNIDPQRLEMQVENGIVSVAGSFGIAEISEILHTVKFTRGVRDIVNLLQVRRDVA
ncbi:BON domain-containing protein [Chitinispirillales bacterium ANBcel5]|uniref:BON domain-containing protein n=1 Tax=Cellulosispirillum alkaliphilum TaxID=3039283 RepID=UPI002A57AEEF|nr:BON domain-containing protein [Chitinispirillales bacterium ANBcel5]